VPTELAVSLVPRRRVAVSVHGSRASHRGRGDLAGARPQVVRELFAENATRVVLVRDRRPSMALFPGWSPRLCKPYACGAVGRLLAASARRARCAFREQDDELAHALEALAIGRRGRGSFAFLISDFLVLPPEDVWQEAFDRGWDIVPVVLQDPVWERSFPHPAGLVLPSWDANARRECAARRKANEERFLAISERFDRLGLDPIQLASHDDVSVWRAFHAWSEARRVDLRISA
jgi:hypothetical protein